MLRVHSAIKELIGGAFPLDGLGATSAFSASRNLLSAFVGDRYTLSGGLVTNAIDQTGNSRHMAPPSFPTNAPVIATAGANNRDAFSCDGAATYLQQSTVASSSITASTGYIVCSLVIDAVDTNGASIFDNDPAFTDSAAIFGIFLKNAAGAHTATGYNFDGTSDVTATFSISTGTSYVMEWKHGGGILSARVNLGGWQMVASGDTNTPSGFITWGAKTSGVTPRFTDERVVEFATFNSILTTSQEDVLASNLLAWMG